MQLGGYFFCLLPMVYPRPKAVSTRLRTAMKSVICIVLSSFLVDFKLQGSHYGNGGLTTYHFTIALKVIILYFTKKNNGSFALFYVCFAN